MGSEEGDKGKGLSPEARCKDREKINAAIRQLYVKTETDAIKWEMRIFVRAVDAGRMPSWDFLKFLRSAFGLILLGADPRKALGIREKPGRPSEDPYELAHRDWCISVNFKLLRSEGLKWEDALKETARVCEVSQSEVKRSRARLNQGGPVGRDILNGKLGFVDDLRREIHFLTKEGVISLEAPLKKVEKEQGSEEQPE